MGVRVVEMKLAGSISSSSVSNDLCFQFAPPCRANVVELMEACLAHSPKLVARRSRNKDRLGAFGAIPRIWNECAQQKVAEPD